MKQQTIEKRIWKAIWDEPLSQHATPEGLKRMFHFIYSDFLEFEREEDNHTSSENLDFAIDIWLRDGIEVICNVYDL